MAFCTPVQPEFPIQLVPKLAGRDLFCDRARPNLLADLSSGLSAHWRGAPVVVS